MVGCIRRVRFGVWRSWDASFRRIVCRLAAGAMLGCLMAGQANAADEPIVFDLPAQPLAAAIESYSVASGWQVIYDASLAAGRRSAAVTGRFTPAEALRLLLSGTGLHPETMAADGVLLQPDPDEAIRQTPPIEADARLRDYYGVVQTNLKRALCADDQFRSGAYRIALGVWVGSSGEIMRAVPLDSTGRAEVDAAFDRAVRRAAVGLPPPAGFEQPIVILVTPDLAAQCNAAAARQARVAR